MPAPRARAPPRARALSPQPPPPPKDPFGGEQGRDDRKGPRCMPHVALLGRRALRNRRLEPCDDAAGLRGTNVAAARRASDAAQESLVEARIGELAIRAADVEPSFGDAQRRRPFSRVDADAVQAR